MLTNHLKQCRSTGFAIAAVLAAVGGALASSPADAAAAQRLDLPPLADARPARVDDVDFEKVFWICDQAAATRMVSASEGVICNAVADHLKAEKFDGDFEKMLNWWRANKVEQYERLERQGESNARK